MKPLTEDESRSADELELYAVNTGELYPERRRIELRMAADMRDGKAIRNADGSYPSKYFRLWIEAARDRYRWEIGRDGGYHFTKRVLDACARSLAADTYDAIRNGEIDLPEPSNDY